MSGSRVDEDLRALRMLTESMLFDKIHWVGGYMYGRTKENDDPFIVLYSPYPQLQQKVGKVYVQDFRKLPKFVDTENVPAKAPRALLTKDEARDMGLYIECPKFQILNRDGKETQMGPEQRFHGVLRLTDDMSHYLSQPAKQAAPQQQQQRQAMSQANGRPAAGETPSDVKLPNYGDLAVNAKTFEEFDYAAFMALRGDIFVEQEHVKKIRDLIVEKSESGVLMIKEGDTRSNDALLVAMDMYRKERKELEKGGSTRQEAHTYAMRRAVEKYDGRS